MQQQGKVGQIEAGSVYPLAHFFLALGQAWAVVCMMWVDWLKLYYYELFPKIRSCYLFAAMLKRHQDGYCIDIGYWRKRYAK